MMSLTNSVFNKKSGLPWQVIGDQALILVPEKQEAHELNETACFIWQQLDGKNSVDHILSALQQTFDVEHDVAEQDLKTSLQDLQSLGLVEAL